MLTIVGVIPYRTFKERLQLMKKYIGKAYIDIAMESLKNKQHKLCSPEKYEALKMFYIEEMTHEKVAEQLSYSVINARRWINEILNELSINLFGIDGMKLYMI